MADNLNFTPDMIDNLVNMLKNGLNENSSTKNADSINNSTESDSSNNFDFETIMKMKSIMETLNNNNDQNSKLLYSLKPYLRKSRQEKIDQYINLLKLSQITKLFNQKGDDN